MSVAVSENFYFVALMGRSGGEERDRVLVTVTRLE